MFGLLFIVIPIVLFVWFVAVVLRAIGGLFRMILPAPNVQPLPPLMPSAPNVVRCRRSNCRSINPTHARFCRQCGMALAASTVDPRVTNPRVAGEHARRVLSTEVPASRLAS